MGVYFLYVEIFLFIIKVLLTSFDYSGRVTIFATLSRIFNKKVMFVKGSKSKFGCEGMGV